MRRRVLTAVAFIVALGVMTGADAQKVTSKTCKDVRYDQATSRLCGFIAVSEENQISIDMRVGTDVLVCFSTNAPADTSRQGRRICRTAREWWGMSGQLDRLLENAWIGR